MCTKAQFIHREASNDVISCPEPIEFGTQSQALVLIPNQLADRSHNLRYTRAIGVFENRGERYRHIGRSDSYHWRLEVLAELFLDTGRDFGAYPAGFRAFFDDHNTVGLLHRIADRLIIDGREAPDIDDFSLDAGTSQLSSRIKAKVQHQ